MGTKGKEEKGGECSLFFFFGTKNCVLFFFGVCLLSDGFFFFLPFFLLRFGGVGGWGITFDKMRERERGRKKA